MESGEDFCGRDSKCATLGAVPIFSSGREQSGPLHSPVPLRTLAFGVSSMAVAQDSFINKKELIYNDQSPVLIECHPCDIAQSILSHISNRLPFFGPIRIKKINIGLTGHHNTSITHHDKIFSTS